MCLLSPQYHLLLLCQIHHLESALILCKHSTLLKELDMLHETFLLRKPLDICEEPIARNAMQRISQFGTRILRDGLAKLIMTRHSATLFISVAIANRRVRLGRGCVSEGGFLIGAHGFFISWAPSHIVGMKLMVIKVWQIIERINEQRKLQGQAVAVSGDSSLDEQWRTSLLI